MNTKNIFVFFAIKYYWAMKNHQLRCQKKYGNEKKYGNNREYER